MFLDQRGEVCPVPVLNAKRAIEEGQVQDELRVAVDNQAALENLEKLGRQKGLEYQASKLGPAHWEIVYHLGSRPAAAPLVQDPLELQLGQGRPESQSLGLDLEHGPRQATLLFLSDLLGEGDPALGRKLIQGFCFSLRQLELLPERLIFMNRGIFLSTEGSSCLEDLRALEAAGVEVLSCGTCLDYYGRREQLALGSVANMYEIVSHLMASPKVLRI